MTSHNIRLRSLNLHILLSRKLSGFNPFQCLAWCHIQIGFQEILFLFLINSACLQITWTISLLIFLDRAIDTLAGGKSVFILIDKASGINLPGSDTLCNGSGWGNSILTSQCDKAHLKGCHLGSRLNPHCISGSCIKRRIPHFMSGKARIIWLVKSCSASRCYQNSLCFDHIGLLIPQRKSHGTVNSSALCQKLCDIHPV